MPEYRRYHATNQIAFVTIVTRDRHRYFANAEMADALLTAMRKTKTIHPYQHIAHVILPDHVHWMFKVLKPSNFSDVVTTMKRSFTWGLKNQGKAAGSLWQPRFYDHVIRDEVDFAKHLDYIHFNPVKHRLVQSAGDYPGSSFLQWVERGVYEMTWGTADQPPSALDEMNLE